MSEQPESDPALDVALEKAKVGAGETNPKVFSVSGLVDTFKKDFDTETVVEKKKNEKIREELEPLVNKLITSYRTSYPLQSFERGKERYAEIIGDKVGYKDSLNLRHAFMLKQAGLRDELVREYRSKGGTGKVEDIFTELTMHGPKGGHSRAELERELKQEFSFKMENFDDTEKDQEKIWSASQSFLQDKLKHEGEGSMEGELEGFGLTALDNGNVSVAGQAFGILEQYGSIRPEILKTIQESLEFSPRGSADERKRAFISAYEKGKEEAKSEKM